MPQSEGSGVSREKKKEKKKRGILAVIFAVASDAKTAGLDGWETETDGLAEGSGVDVRDAVVVAHAAVGEVEPLPGDISVGIGGVICGEPGRKDEMRFEERKKRTKPGRKFVWHDQRRWW